MNLENDADDHNINRKSTRVFGRSFGSGFRNLSDTLRKTASLTSRSGIPGRGTLTRSPSKNSSTLKKSKSKKESKLKSKKGGYTYFYPVGVSAKVLEDFMEGILMSDPNRAPSESLNDARVILYEVQEETICERRPNEQQEDPNTKIRIRQGEFIRVANVNSKEPRVDTFDGVVLRDELEIHLLNVPFKNVREIPPREWTLEDVRQHIIIPSTREKGQPYVEKIMEIDKRQVSNKMIYVSAPRTSAYISVVQSILQTTELRYTSKSGRSGSVANSDVTSTAFSAATDTTMGSNSSPPEDVFYWLDIFCVNQHEDPTAFRHRSVSVHTENSLRASVRRTISRGNKTRKQDLFDEFNGSAYAAKVGLHRSMETNAEGFILYADDYMYPEFVKRGWCLWEIYGASKAKGSHESFSFDIAFDLDKETELQDTIRNEEGFKKVMNAIANAKWDDAEWRPGDDSRFSIESQIYEREKVDVEKHVCKQVNKMLKLGFCSYANIVLKRDKRTRFLKADAIYSLNKSLANVWKNDFKSSKGAEKYMKGMLDYERSKFGTSDDKTLATMVTYGAMLSNIGRYKQAEGIYSEIIAIMEKEMGRRQTSVAVVLNNLGRCLLGQGKYEEALKCHREALDINIEVTGEISALVAKSYSNIALVYKKQGDYTQALEYYQKAVDIRQEAEGFDNPNVATCYSNVASVYYEIQEYQNALDYYKKAEDIRREKLGENHSLTKDSASHIANIERLLLYQNN